MFSCNILWIPQKYMKIFFDCSCIYFCHNTTTYMFFILFYKYGLFRVRKFDFLCKHFTYWEKNFLEGSCSFFFVVVGHFCQSWRFAFWIAKVAEPWPKLKSRTKMALIRESARRSMLSMGGVEIQIQNSPPKI